MRRVGRRFEAAAAAWLERRGLTILDRNFHARWGEIDLVVRDGNVIAFVEVRFRRSDRHGGAAASVDARKRRRIQAAAAEWLARHPDRGRGPCRFDVIALALRDGRLSGRWIRRAFEAEDPGSHGD